MELTKGKSYHFGTCFTCKGAYTVEGDLDACPLCGGAISDPDAVVYNVVATSPTTFQIATSPENAKKGKGVKIA